MSKPKFQKLFEPTQIGQMQLRNRMVMPPMGTSFAEDKGYVSQRLIDYYEARAIGGVGLIIVEITAPYFPGRQFGRELAISDDSYIPGFRKLAEAIHKHGAKVAVQLHHAGWQVKKDLTGYPPVGPSPIALFPGEIPRVLNTDEITEIIQQFAAGAKRAKKAGIDGVEIHGAHQYLISSFLSAATNKREDEYGGTVENRARFLIKVIQSTRQAVGTDYPVWIRLNAQEYGVENGISIEEAKQIAKMAVDAGAQAVHVSAFGTGYHATKAPLPDIPGFLLPLVEEVKKVAGVPVIAVGRMDAEIAERVLEEGKADLVSVGRGLIADPDLPNKVAEDKLHNINPCIGCLECLERLVFDYVDVTCTVNAAMGREKEYHIQRANNMKRVVVVGGGPAGMEVARVAGLRGHHVVLFEKEPKLGGLLNLASLPPNKQELFPLIEYLGGQLQRVGVDIRLSTEATPELIIKSNPDAVIVAVGGTPIIPDIAGVDKPNVATAEAVLSGQTEIGQNVVIIGGGMVGCETGHFLVNQGKTVTVIEILNRVAEDMMPLLRYRLIKELTGKRVALLAKTGCEEITQDGVTIITGEGYKQTIHADTAVLAVGYKANDSLFKALQGKVHWICCIGDSSQPRRIRDAIDDGYRVGLSL